MDFFSAAPSVQNQQAPASARPATRRKQTRASGRPARRCAASPVRHLAAPARGQAQPGSAAAESAPLLSRKPRPAAFPQGASAQRPAGAACSAPGTSDTQETAPSSAEIKSKLLFLLFAVLVETASPDPPQNAVFTFQAARILAFSR